MRTLLLAGGGLTHAFYLANARHLLPDDTRVVLLSPERFVPYSGMLPGLIAGHYRFRDCHIDLGALCRHTGTELTFARLQSLDPDQKQAHLDNGEVIAFDLLSLNTGLQAPTHIEGLHTHGMSLRSISRFLPRWQGALNRLRNRPRNAPADLVVVGGNVDGIEMALAIRRFLNQDTTIKAPVTVHLAHSGGKLLPDMPLAAQLRAAQLLQEREVRVHPLFEVSQVNESQVRTRHHQHLPADEVLWCVSGKPGRWVREAGLPLTENGLLQVDRHLQVAGHPDIFAAGALASVAGGHQGGAAATLAWRQAPVLSANLARRLAGERLRRFRPNKPVITTIITQDRYGLARYGQWVWGSRWLEAWKRRRDLKIMRRFPRP